METGSDGGDQSRLRQLNERAVLRAVRGAGRLRVSELVDQTGLGRTAIEDLVLSLVERRWLTEERSAAIGEVCGAVECSGRCTTSLS